MNNGSEIKPIVLPDPIRFKDFGGDRNKYLERLYEVFKSDFCVNKATFNGLRVFPLRDPIKDGRMQSFNHIISSGDEELFRTESFSRAEKIPWISPILKSVPHPNLKVWENIRKKGKKKKKKVSTIIWYEEKRLLIVLERNNDRYFLVTAYSKTKPKDIDRLRKEYEDYIKNGLPV